MIYFEKYDKIVIVHMENKLTIDVIKGIKETVADAISSGESELSLLALNFEFINLIDSCGISYLVDLLKETKALDIRLVFYNMSESLERLFLTGGLDSFFTIVSKEKFSEMMY